MIKYIYFEMSIKSDCSFEKDVASIPVLKSIRPILILIDKKSRSLNTLQYNIDQFLHRVTILFT